METIQKPCLTITIKKRTGEILDFTNLKEEKSSIKNLAMEHPLIFHINLKTLNMGKL